MVKEALVIAVTPNPEEVKEPVIVLGVEGGAELRLSLDDAREVIEILQRQIVVIEAILNRRNSGQKYDA